MDHTQILPCGPSALWFHFAIVSLQSVTIVLTTWLTVRARRRDRKENGHHVREREKT